jgi:monoamine oxidase
MRVAVVGAGLAGLACATDLVRAGIDVTVIEARSRAGGRVWSDAMPDGARFERGGEFVEAGYDHLRRRAAEHGLALAAQGFAFAAREVRSEGRTLPSLLQEAEQVVATVLERLGPAAAGASAAEAIEQAPLGALARNALTRRLEGTYTVKLDRVSAEWLASAELRASEQGEEAPSARLAAGNEALAVAMAGRLAGRLRLGCPIGALRDEGAHVAVQPLEGGDERYDRVVVTLPHPLALELLPALRERASYARLVFGVASKLHVPLATPATPAAVQGLDAAFWTWTASGTAGGPATFASSFAGGSDAEEALEIALGAERWRARIQALRPELALTGDAVLTNWGADPLSTGSYACHPPGWSRRDDEELCAPAGRVHLAGEHTAAEWCGTMEGALRSGTRAASEVLALQLAGEIL